MGIKINFEGKKVLITGATRGIGKSIADVFVQCGAKVFLTGTNKESINQLNLLNKNSLIKWVQADFSTQENISLFLKSLDKLTNIDICINNAGVNTIKAYEDYSINEYQKLINVNLTAPFQIIQNLLPNMKRKQFGRIVNIASIWSAISKSKRSLYCISKTGLVGLTRSLAVEQAEQNILVNSISPGFTHTELTEESLKPREIDDLSKQVPMKRFAEPTEIANTVLFLCSHLNTYITGQNILVDGGFTSV